ncbi:uncharacterized protein LOC125682249 [Ostrea edulis]|uniref:uncharacterized protein LOC125682249 n=1 Tax=Ostrea edulis TaxID=37623 RepID=UPI0024AF11D5|nr:uncharacterized protein LOC125682249 [Ostrea edulis]
MKNMSFLISALYLMSAITVTVADYCSATNNEFFCEYGCCGNSCCPNTVAIGVGSTFGGILLLIIAGGVFICCIQRRYSPKEDVKITKDIFTQWEKDPAGIDMLPTAEKHVRNRRSTIAPLPPPAFALRQNKLEEIGDKEENQQPVSTDSPV